MSVRRDKDSYLTNELLQRKNDTTPDFLKMKLRGDFLPVFVYGTLKSGGRLASALDGSAFLGEAGTVTSTYKMMISSGNFPVVRPVTKGGGQIMGEVYMCHPRTILRLDEIEANGTMYDRQERHVWLYDQSYLTDSGRRVVPSVRASMYVGNADFWKGINMPVVPVRQNSKGDYYEFDVNTRLAA